MVVHKVNIEGAATDKSENNPPIGAHRHRPIAPEVACQSVKPKGHNVKVGNLLGGML
jgi:hypothetical protein